MQFQSILLRVFVACRFALALTVIVSPLWLLSPRPVLAACAPPAPVNNTTVVCDDTTNANPPNGYGTGAETGLTINVLSGATVSGTNNGIWVDTNNIINNAGTITGLTAAPDGNGIQAGSLGAGAITLTVNNAAGATISGELNGIAAINAANDAMLNVVNYGTVTATGTGGFQAAIAGNTVNVTNFGTISALGVGSDGIDAFVGTGTATIANYGTISADTNAISVANGTIVNYASGTITQVRTLGGFAVSIAVNGSLANYGTITGNSIINAAVAVTFGKRLQCWRDQ
jgi:hypothetical protein